MELERVGQDAAPPPSSNYIGWLQTDLISSIGCLGPVAGGAGEGEAGPQS